MVPGLIPVSATYTDQGLRQIAVILKMEMSILLADKNVYEFIY